MPHDPDLSVPSTPLGTSARKAFLDVWRRLSPALVLILVVGGLFQPLLGLGVLALMAVALVLNARKRRSFCAGICPNGNLLALGLRPFSRGKPFPRQMASPEMRRMFCGFMMICLFAFLARGGQGAAGLGQVFSWIYLIAVGGGLALGLYYKPRAWCTICPMGTLQDSISMITSSPLDAPRRGKREDGGR